MAQMSAILSCFGVASADKINSNTLKKLLRVCAEDNSAVIRSAISDKREKEMRQIITQAVEQIEGAIVSPFSQLDSERNIFVAPVVIENDDRPKFAVIAVKYDTDADSLELSVITAGKETDITADTTDIDATTTELVDILTNL